MKTSSFVKCSACASETEWSPIHRFCGECGAKLTWPSLTLLKRQRDSCGPAKAEFCPQYWGDHAKRCLLLAGHDGECAFPLTAKDVQDFANSCGCAPAQRKVVAIQVDACDEHRGGVDTCPACNQAEKQVTVPLVESAVAIGKFCHVTIGHYTQGIGPLRSQDAAVECARVLTEARVPAERTVEHLGHRGSPDTCPACNHDAKPAEDGGPTCTGAEFVDAAQAAIKPRSDEEIGQAIEDVEGKGGK